LIKKGRTEKKDDRTTEKSDTVTRILLSLLKKDKTDNWKLTPIRKMLLGRKKWEKLEKRETGRRPSFSFGRRNHYRYICNERNETNQCQNPDCFSETIDGAMEHLEKQKRNNGQQTCNGQHEQGYPTAPDGRNLDEEETKNHTTIPLEAERNEILLELLETEPNDIWINAKTNLAMDLAIEENIKKEDLKPEEIVPKAYHEYLDVSTKKKLNGSLKHDHGTTRSK